MVTRLDTAKKMAPNDTFQNESPRPEPGVRFWAGFCRKPKTGNRPFGRRGERCGPCRDQSILGDPRLVATTRWAAGLRPVAFATCAAKNMQPRKPEFSADVSFALRRPG